MGTDSTSSEGHPLFPSLSRFVSMAMERIRLKM